MPTGFILNKQMKEGDPVAGVPASFYNNVDEVLSLLDVYGGHIERNPGNAWVIVVDDPGGAGLSSQPHRFRPTINDSDASTVDISAGGWFFNGVAAVNADTEGLGDTANPYIVATITHDTAAGPPVQPSAIEITADSDAAMAAEWTTKRNLCHLNYDTAGEIESIERYQVGDIVSNATSLEDTADVWGVVEDTQVLIEFITDIQYNDSSHTLEKKVRECTVKNGTFSIGKESAWDTVTTASNCPDT